MDSLREVAVPTFVNPHLFWLIEPKSSERIKTLNDLHNVMQNFYQTNVSQKNHSFEIGEIVIVEINTRYFRAIIENILNPESDVENVLVCWLIDYGTIYETNKVLKLPSHLRKTPPLAIQASLNNVTYIQQHLTYDHLSGEAMKIGEHMITPTSIAHQASIDIISNSTDLQFKVENKVDGILLGDILYKEGKEMKSLRQSLIQKGILVINEILFQQIQENIHSYKEKHLSLIVQVCRKLNSSSILEDSNSNHNCWKITSKYLEEFGNIELYDDFELLQPLANRRGRSKITMTNSENSGTNTASDNDSPIEVGKANSDTDHSQSSGFETKLFDKLKIKTATSDNEELNVDKSLCADDRLCKKNIVDSSNTVITSAVDAKQKLAEYWKTKKLTPIMKDDVKKSISVDGQRLSSYGPSIIKHCEDVQKLVSENTVFPPGEASYTMLNVAEKCALNTEREPCDGDGNWKTEKVTKESCEDTSVISDADSLSVENYKVELKETSFENKNIGQLKIKPHCSCKQCEHWTHDKDWQIKLNTFDKSNPTTTCLNLMKPEKLFKDKITNDWNIVAVDYSSWTKIQKQTTPKLLIHGESIPSPIKMISQANFYQNIYNNLRQLGYREAKRIQTYSWPAIFRQQHVCMINGLETGKTIGYLPVILTFLLEKNERYGPLILKAGGPIFIILCANSKKCEEIYDLSKVLLGRNRVKLSLITYPLTHINTSQVDLLVTTPTILIDLLKTKAVTFKRLCHLILDDGDEILKYNSEIMNKIFDLTQLMLDHRVHSKPVQLIICGEHWSRHIENVLNRLTKAPLICIGNYLEAALYGKIQISMRFMNSACKELELKNLLKETYRINKSIIVCKSTEIEEVQTILMLKGIDATVVSEDLSKENIIYLEEVWTKCKGGQFTVLVCTDFLLNSLLTVTSASLLIHYSLPASWTKFVKRFSSLLENCNSPFNKKEAKIKCQSIILCDEECEDNMVKFFDFIDMTELKNQLPDKFKKFSENLKLITEVNKVKNQVRLCETLKLFGRCRTNQCPRRHILDKNLDISSYWPSSGKIKFKILHIQDVTTYSIQLLQHISLENNIHEFNDIIDVTEDLTNTLNISRKRVEIPVIGQSYAFYDIDVMDGIYYRCELLKIKNDFIKIKLMDNGNIISTMKSRLFKLPNEFNDINKPRKVIDAYLANCIPPYGDENYSAKSFHNLKALLEKYNYSNIIMSADIHLQLGNALWLKNVNQEVVVSEKSIPDFQLSMEIKQKKLAEYNNNQLISLYNLCNEASIMLPTYEKHEEPIKRQIKISASWAHLDNDQSNEVIFCSAISPNEIYFRLNKFDHQLYMLQKDIQDSLKKPNYPKLHNLEIGTFCLAKDPEGDDYSRAIVCNIENNRALCFFVDFGDEFVIDFSNLKHIAEKFVTKLPFQSIQCRLHGVKPISDDWQTDVTNVLYEYAMEPDTDIFRTLFVKSCHKEENKILPEQNRYSVILKDGFGEKHYLINNLLIDCGLAISNSEEIYDIDIPKEIYENETDEELENIIDICRKTREIEENFCSTRPQTQAELEPEMGLFIINPMEFFEELIESRKCDVETQRNDDLPAMRAAPAVDYYTPEVLWSQSDKFIKIDIKLHDVEQYTLSLTKGRVMNFRTVQNEKTYIVKLTLYEKVNAIQHTSMGTQVRATLTKIKDTEWPRLILSKQRARNIHYDLLTLNYTEDTKKILELPKTSDDERESDNEHIDIMYNVVSDLDSDMDADMPIDSD